MSGIVLTPRAARELERTRHATEIAKVQDAAQATADAWSKGPQLRQIVATTDLTGLAQQLIREPFTPGVPIAPVHPEKTEPRRWDYDPGYNIALAPRNWEPISFTTLRYLTEASDIASICVERNIDDFRELDFEIRPRVVKGMTRQDAKKRADQLKDTRSEIEGFWETPDQEHGWGSWVHMYLDELYKIDGACMYLRKTINGDKLHSVRITSGDTIAPIIDVHGYLPDPPEPAYRQVIRGLTWTMYARDLEKPAHEREFNFDRSILLYDPFWARVKGPYGHPPIETILLTVNRIINRQALDYKLFADGTIPHGFWKAPETYSATEISQLRDAWEKIQSNATARAQLQFMPGGTGTGYEAGFLEPKTEGEMMLAKIIYAAYKRSPLKDGILDHKGSGGFGAGQVAQEQGESANRALKTLAKHLLGQINRIIAEYWTPDLVMVLPAFADPAVDSLQKAQERGIYVTRGILSRDEIRDDMDRDPIATTNEPTNTVDTKDGAALIAPIMEGKVDPAAATAPPSVPPATGERQPGAPGATRARQGGGSPATPSAAPGENTDEQSAGVAKALGAKHVEYTGDLAKVVQRYLLRSYPAADVVWVLDPAITWEYETSVPLDDINYARRPGGRDEDKVASISDSVDAGASMDPVVLADFGEPKLRIADGFHRILGAEKAGEDAVPAFVGHDVPESYRTTVMGPMQADSSSVAKAELGRWQRKALNALRAGRRAAVKFDTTLPDETCAKVWVGLTGARTPEDVRRVFAKALPAGEPERPLPPSSRRPATASSASGGSGSVARVGSSSSRWETYP